MSRSPQPAGPASRGVLIRPMEPADAGQVLAIYQAGLDTGQASFETTAPAWEHFDATKLPPTGTWPPTRAPGRCWAGPPPSPCPTVRLRGGDRAQRLCPSGQPGRGVGAALLAALIASAEEAGIWTIQSGVFPENTASLRLHQQAGFRVVGTRERIGRHHGRWRDTVLIERRSAVAGTG